MVLVGFIDVHHDDSIIHQVSYEDGVVSAHEFTLDMMDR